jgi:protection of telomeres protein 1
MNYTDSELVRCAFPDEETVSISQILKPQGLHLENQECDCPFTLSKYRANVRVVDYFPHKIEDFAVGRRASEFDMLSDYSGGEDTDPEEDMLIFKSGKGFKKNVWEWRFALKVEDAETKNPKDRIWLMVDNQAAQGLLGLEDDATK